MSLTAYATTKRALHRLGGFRRRARRLLHGRPVRAPTALPHALPKRIWIYWHQGEEAAPPLVRRCLRSWRETNPGWEVIVLDAETHRAHVDMPALPGTISLAHYADVLRSCLLEKHGGVWADATIFCTRPLEDWLPMLAGQSGFFAFSWIPGDREFLGEAGRRTIGNWFLASEPGGTVISAWTRVTLDYWDGRAAASHYFWHNDSFEWLLLSDRAVRRAWARTPHMGALAPHLAWHYLTTGRDEDRVRAALATGAVPLHKLSWRMETPIDEIETLLMPGTAAP